MLATRGDKGKRLTGDEVGVDVMFNFEGQVTVSCDIILR